jgi:hypothetical protein
VFSSQDPVYSLIMAVEQENRFVLNLALAESYIYGTAITADNSYSINIQQGSNNLVVLPSDLFNILTSQWTVIVIKYP